MAINRYTQYQPTRYNPRSLQELMVAPMYKRQQHDNLESNIAKANANLAEIDYMDVHDPAVVQTQEKLRTQLDDQINKLSSEGFNNANKSDFIRFSQDYSQEMGPKGTLGKAQAAKKAYAETRKQIMEQAAKEGHDPRATEQQLNNAYQQYANQFGETGEITNFQGIQPPKYQDLQEDIKDIKSQLGETVTTNRGNEGYRIITDPQTGRLVVQTESGQEIIGDNKDQLEFAISKLQSKWLDPRGEGYQSAQWNLQDPNYISDQIGTGLNMMRERSSRNTRQNAYNFTALKEDNDEKRRNGQMSYENAPVETVRIRDAKLSDQLNDVINKRIVRGTDLKSNILSGAYDNINEVPRGTVGKPYSLDDLNEEQKNQYNTIASGLREMERIPSPVQPNSEEEMRYVKEYIDSNQEITHNNKLITSDLIKMYGEGSEGVNSTTPKALAEDIALHYDTRTFYDPDSGEIIEGDDLPEDIRNALTSGKGKVSGYYSPKNLWSLGISKESDRSMFTSPIELQINTEDGPVKLLASRKSSEFDDPEYKADRQFSDIYAQTNTMPDIPREFNIGGMDVKIAKVTRPTQEMMKTVAQDIIDAENLTETEKKDKLSKLNSQSLYITNTKDNDEPLILTEDDLRYRLKELQ